jgi:quinate dehydrogenase (quinone)
VFPALVLMMTLWSGAAYPGVSVATRRLGNTGALATFVALLATLVAAFFPHGTISDPVAITADPAAAKASADPGD